MTLTKWIAIALILSLLACTKSKVNKSSALLTATESLNLVKPVSVDDGNFYNSLSETPPITFSAPGSEPTTLFQAQVIRASDFTITQSWGDFTNGSKISGLTLLDGHQYLVEVRVSDGNGNYSDSTMSDGWLVDSTAPTAPTNLLDGDVGVSFSESPAITFTNSSDGRGSGVEKYLVQVVAMPALNVIKPWTELVSGRKITGLSLTNRTTYKLQLKAIDKAQNESTVVSSDGWTPQLTNLLISWNANKEKAVNKVGGGYKVYYSKTQNFSLTGAQVIVIPYVSGPKAPSSTTISVVGSGTWYFKILAFSALNGGSQSLGSTETSVVIP